MRRDVRDHRDRDRALERLLPQALDDVSRDPASRCVDAETLAAWSSRALRADEAARVEAHLADCAHCQDVLGILVRTAPPQVSRRARAPWHTRWLVPLATAATALALYLLVPGRGPVPTPPAETMIGEAQPRRNLPPTPEPPPARQELAAAPPPAAVEADRLAAAQPAPGQTAPLDQATSKDAGGRVEAKPSALADSARVREAQAPSASPASQPVNPPVGSSAASKTLEERVTILPSAPAPPAASAAPAAPAPAAVPTAPAEAAAQPPTGAAAERRADAAFRMQARADLYISTPAATHRYRIVGGQRVERTTTGGRTWETLARATDGELLAGAAPAPDVCWIVGRRGAVWRTTDGHVLERVSFPQPLDLVAVTATSALAATVTAADGRTLQTVDGGQTWALR
jgi:hypothetical protein